MSETSASARRSGLDGPLSRAEREAIDDLAGRDRDLAGHRAPEDLVPAWTAEDEERLAASIARLLERDAS